MKNKILLTFCIVLLAMFCKAQDRLFFKNGNMVAAKVLEISDTKVTYKKATNIDGPTYTDLKSDLLKIEFANGQTKQFSSPEKKVDIKINATTVVESTVTPEPPKLYKKNIIAYNVLDNAFKRITVSYEHIFLNGHLGVKIPFTFGLGSNKVLDVDYINNYNNSNVDNNYSYYNYYNNSTTTKFEVINRKSTIGVELNAYPFGMREFSYVVGPSFYYGWMDYTYITTQNIYDSHNYTTYSYETETSKKATAFLGMIHNGFLFSPDEKFSIGLNLGIGFRKDFTDLEDQTIFLIKPAFEIGYKF